MLAQMDVQERRKLARIVSYAMVYLNVTPEVTAEVNGTETLKLFQFIEDNLDRKLESPHMKGRTLYEEVKPIIELEKRSIAKAVAYAIVFHGGTLNEAAEAHKVPPRELSRLITKYLDRGLKSPYTKGENLYRELKEILSWNSLRALEDAREFHFGKEQKNVIFY